MLGREPACPTFQGRVVPRCSIYIYCHHNGTSDEDNEGEEDNDENDDDDDDDDGGGGDHVENIAFLRPTHRYKYYCIAMLPFC